MMALVGIVMVPDPSVLFFVAIVAQCKKKTRRKVEHTSSHSPSVGRAAYLPSAMLATLKRLAAKTRDEDAYEL